MIFERLRDERGVAAITVLLVTVVLSLSGAIVVYSATTELGIGARDRRAEDAFSAAEGGLDIAAARLFRQPTWSDEIVSAGYQCLNNPLVDDAREERDAATDAVCGIRITSPVAGGRFIAPITGRPFIEYTVVSKAIEGRTVNRTLAATYRLDALDIPFGLFVNGNVDLNGTPDLLCISMLVNGTVTSRQKLSTDCNGNGAQLFDDPDLAWNFHRDRITSEPAPDMCGSVGCTGVFSNFQNFSKKEKISDEIHYAGPSLPPLAPSSSAFPRDRDVHQTKLDGGEQIPVVRLPSEEILEPMDQLKAIADAQELYFDFRNGDQDNVQMQPGDIGAPDGEFAPNVVVYFDADADDTIGWKVDLIPGSTESDILHTNSAGQRVGPPSGVLVVRGGSLQMESNTQWSGAAFVPEGTFRVLGGASFTGTIYANGFESEGGNSTIRLTPEWFGNLPTGLARVLRTGFFECEPYQVYAPGSPCESA
ncbi:MAG: PilX N-terminal domain-containing pilus assembly protein [Actinomycetota bacterium]